MYIPTQNSVQVCPLRGLLYTFCLRAISQNYLSITIFSHFPSCMYSAYFVISYCQFRCEPVCVLQVVNWQHFSLILVSEKFHFIHYLYPLCRLTEEQSLLYTKSCEFFLIGSSFGTKFKYFHKNPCIRQTLHSLCTHIGVKCTATGYSSVAL